MEAVCTNVIGVDKVLTAAIEVGVKKGFAFLPTMPLIPSMLWGSAIPAISVAASG